MALSTYTQYQGLEASEKIVLVVLEAAKQLVGWEVHSGSVYVCDFTDADVVVSIEENGTALTAVASIVAINAAGKYYHDRDANLIYLRAVDSGNPNGHIEACTFQLFFSNIPVKAPYDLSSGFDVQWVPYVKSTSEFGVELDNYNQFGLAIEGSGKISLINDPVYWGPIYDKLTFENQRVYVYSWNRDIPITQAKLIYRGRTQRRSWSLTEISFELKDQLNELRAPIAMANMEDVAGARLPTNLLQAKQRFIYGRVYGHRPTNYDHVLTGYPLTGTVAVTLSSATVTGTSTQFLKELSPNDQLTFGSGTTKYVVKTVTSDTSITLTQVYASVSGSGVSATVKPSHPKRYINREFLVAGHELREPVTTVSAASNSTQFECADLTDIEPGDALVVGSENAVVLRTSGNTLVLTGPLNSIPTVGATVTRPAISNVYLNDRLLTVTRDYTYSAADATITLDEEAEFNVAPQLRITGTSLAFTSASRTVTGTATQFKKDVKPGDWVRRQGQTDWFEVLSVDSDTSLTLRSNCSYSSTGDADLKSPDVYEESKVILSCDVLGLTDDGTTAGALLKTAGSIVEDLLIRAGLEDQLSAATFTEADDDCQWTLGLVLPEQFGTRAAPTYRDAIELVNKSVFGSLVQNEDFELEYQVISPGRTYDTTAKLKKTDVVKFSVETNSDKLVKTVLVDYLAKEWDQAAEAKSVAQASASSVNGQYLAKSTKEFSIETNLVKEDEAQIYANRWAFILGVGTTILKFTSRLQAARLQVADLVELQHDKLYERLGSSDKARLGAIRYLKQNAFDVSVELEDLANAFARVAIITENDAADYDDADESERRYNGYITDTYGMQDNDPDTHGVNLIW